VGETRVDLQHLLEDLRDAYTGSLEETILTEIVANALDSGATKVRLQASTAGAALVVADDGHGMQRRELARYHNVAATTKKRGEGIGFAGVGIKLGLLVSKEVITETRRGATHVATRWSLASRYRAPWKWTKPQGLVAGPQGTAVHLALVNPLSPLLDAGFLEETIRRHFEPLVASGFETILRKHYPRTITFEIDGRSLAPALEEPETRVPLAIRLARKRTPSALGYIARSASPIPEDRRGIAVSTFGKVIKRGWDWLGITPVGSDRVTGLVEVPDLAGCLTLSKSDFLRSGTRGATYLAYRKALQEVVSRQLAAWGDTPDQTLNRPRPQRLNRDLERVLEDMADRFPLLHSLVERRAGGQTRLPIPQPDGAKGVTPLLSMIEGNDAEEEPAKRLEEEKPPEPGAETSAPQTEQEPPAKPPATPQDEEDGSAALAALPGGRQRRRSRYGLRLQFERRPDDQEPGRLVESTIWVNEAHPAFERAHRSRSLGYHIALTVALTLAPLAAAPSDEHAFLTRFLAEWGDTETRSRVRRKRRSVRR
jgi:hypothetical protein